MDLRILNFSTNVVRQKFSEPVWFCLSQQGEETGYISSVWWVGGSKYSGFYLSLVDAQCYISFRHKT